MSEIESYFAVLYARIGDAVEVPFERRSTPEWEPSLAECHKNAGYWAALHPYLQVVRGWFVEGPYDFGSYRLIAHSVLDDGGRLFDITPIDPNSARPKFLRHIGTTEVFDAMQPRWSWLFYPPVLANFAPVGDEVDGAEQ
jgi:hypothetical protein